MSADGCLPNEKLKSFLAGQLSAGENEEMEHHLSQCRICRHRLAKMVLDSERDIVSARPPWWLRAYARRIPKQCRAPVPLLIISFRRQIAGALAAVVLLAIGVLLVNQSPGDRDIPAANVLREKAFSQAAPQLLAPTAGAHIGPDEVECRWAPVPGASHYTLYLLNEKGDIVFQTSTTAERLTMNLTETRLQPGKSYFWYVEVIRADGTTSDSEISEVVPN